MTSAACFMAGETGAAKTPGDASAGGAWAITITVDQSSTGTTLFTGPSRRRSRLDWSWRRGRGGIGRDSFVKDAPLTP